MSAPAVATVLEDIEARAEACDWASSPSGPGPFVEAEASIE
jgi:hypothetical protein